MSPEQFGDIFSKSLINGMLTGLVLFLKSGGWYLIGIAILGVLWGVITRKRRRRH